MKLLSKSPKTDLKYYSYFRNDIYFFAVFEQGRGPFNISISLSSVSIGRPVAPRIVAGCKRLLASLRLSKFRSLKLIISRQF
jgi:hypothetical protein